MTTAAILLAGGASHRMQHPTVDKTLALLANQPVLAYSLKAFAACGFIDSVVIVYRNERQRAALAEVCQEVAAFSPAQVRWAPGGARRQDSVVSALSALPTTTDTVFIHDVARPLITAQALNRLKHSVGQHQAAVLAHQVADTIKQVSTLIGPTEPTLLQPLDRSRLWAMETPQVFTYALIHQAYTQVQQQRLVITDDTAAISLLGHPTAIVANDQPNIKITTPDDLVYLEYLLASRHAEHTAST